MIWHTFMLDLDPISAHLVWVHKMKIILFHASFGSNWLQGVYLRYRILGTLCLSGCRGHLHAIMDFDRNLYKITLFGVEFTGPYKSNLRGARAEPICAGFV